MPQSVAFDRAADFYDETRGLPPEATPRVAALFCRAGDLTAHSRVLDVGIGTGRISLPLAPHVHTVTGVDLSRAMLERLHAKRRGERVYPVVGDATWLPFASGAFDAVIAVHVFHLIPGWRTALDDVARVLAPGGLLLSGWNEDTRRNPCESLMWRVWDGVVHKVRLSNVGVSHEQYETFLPDSGWRQVGEDVRLSYPVVRTVRNFVDRLERRVWSSCWRLPDDAVTRGVAAVRAAIEEHGYDVDAPLTIEREFVVQAFVPPG